MNRAERSNVPPSRATLQAQATRRRIILFASLAVIAIGVLVAIGYANRSVPQSASTAPISAQLSIGQQAPEFAVSTTQGPFDLALARGKPTLLEVFATWCPHCQRETAVLDSLYDTYKNRVHIVAVSGSPSDITDQNPETQADVVAFATRFGVRYPVAFDPNLGVAKSYLQSGFPTLVLIGADGRVQSVASGEIPQADIAAALTASAGGHKPDPKMGARGA